MQRGFLIYRANEFFAEGKLFKAYQAEYTEEAESKVHSHDYMQIWYIVKGKCYEYISNKKYEIAAGEIFLIPPFVEHHSRKEAGTIVYCCEFKIDPFLPQRRGSIFNKLSEFVEVPDEMYVIQHLMEYSAESKVIFPLSVLGTKTAERTMKNLVDEYTANKRYSDQFMYVYIQELLLTLAREYEQYDTAPAAAHDEVFAKHKQSILAALNYIEEHYAEPMRLDDLCRVSLVSKTYFCYLFKLLTKQTYSEYLQKVRIQHAMERLEGTNDSITQICFDVGFNDSTHFARTFKKTMGISARTYRKMKQQTNDKKSDANS